MLKKANELQYNQQYQQAVQLYDQFIQTNPDKTNLIAALYNKAQALDQLGRFPDAANCYSLIIDIDPNHMKGELFWEQGQLYQKARMPADCSRAYKRYLEKYPSHSECNFNLGRALETMGQLEEAAVYFQKAYQYKQGYIKAYKAQLSILKKLNKQDDILQTCNEGLKHEPTDFELIYESGLAYYKLNRLKQAYSAFQDSIHANRKFVRGFISLGEVCYKLQKDQQGLQTLQKCLKENKDVMKSTELKEIYLCMGVIKMNLKDFKEAIRCFSSVLSQPPIIESVKGKLAFCLEEEGNQSFAKKNFSDALQCYSQALKYESKRVSLLNNAGLAYQNINNFEEAEKYFRKALELQPSNATALNNLGALQHAKGNEQEAQAIFQKITQSNPASYEGHINKGKQFMLVHKYKEALEEFRKAEKKQSNNFGLFNDMAVALEELADYNQALKYANIANQLTECRSPLLLMNRASIYMNLNKIAEAKLDLDKASKEVANPDRSYLIKLGITAENLKFVFNQLNHYSYLMSPINLFRQGLAREVQSHSELQDKKIYEAIVEKVEKAEVYALSQVMTEIKKEKQPSADPTINPEKARMDRTTVQRWIDDATSLMRAQIQEQNQIIAKMKMDMSVVKKESKQLREKLKYLPESCKLREKLQNLYDSGDKQIWQYGKQLYWILNGYLSGYMLVHSGVVGKGDNIDRSTFSSALSKLGGILEFAQNIPVIGDFSQLISKVCGLFVDMEDDVIIKKMYEVISFNYDTQEELNDAICSTVMLYLNDPNKLQKVRKDLVFDPPVGFLEKIKQKFSDIASWFEEKKHEFVAHMRGFEKAENIMQSELAVIDVGVLISIMLNFESNSQMKYPVLTNAAKKALADCTLEQMVCEAYDRENDNIRVSTNSFCLVMQIQLHFDNPLLNNPEFMQYAARRGNRAVRRVLDWNAKYQTPYILELLRNSRYQQVLEKLE